MRDFVAALRIEGRVFSALVVRELGSRHGGDATGTLWLLIEPMILMGIVYCLHSLEIQSALTVPFIIILLTGYLPHLMLRHAGISGLSAIKANSGLLYHRQVHFLDVAYARMFVETATVLIAFTFVCVGAHYLGILNTPYSMAYVYLGWFFHVWFIMTVCAFVAGAGLVWPIVRRMYVPWTLAMLIPYEAFTMLSWWPTTFQWYLLLFPCTDATELLRYGFFGPAVPTYGNVLYTTLVMIPLTFLSLLVMHWGRKHLEL